MGALALREVACQLEVAAQSEDLEKADLLIADLNEQFDIEKCADLVRICKKLEAHHENINCRR